MKCYLCHFYPIEPKIMLVRLLAQEVQICDKTTHLSQGSMNVQVWMNSLSKNTFLKKKPVSALNLWCWSSASSLLSPPSLSPLQTWITPSWRPSWLPRRGGRVVVGWAPSRPLPFPISGTARECGWGRACWLRVDGSLVSRVSPGGWTSRPQPVGGTVQPTVAQSPWWSWNWAETDRWDWLPVFHILVLSPYIKQNPHPFKRKAPQSFWVRFAV